MDLFNYVNQTRKPEGYFGKRKAAGFANVRITRHPKKTWIAVLTEKEKQS